MGLSKYKIEVTLSNLILTEREIQFIKVILWVSNHSYCTLHSTYSKGQKLIYFGIQAGY